MLEDIVAIVEVELAAAGLERLRWRERVRMGLWTILSFFDRELALARVCVVQAMCAGPVVQARRKRFSRGWRGWSMRVAVRTLARRSVGR